MSRAFVLLFALLVPLAAGCSGEEGASSGSREQNQGDGAARTRAGGASPNVVVILLDTLRPDHLGFYGYQTDTAPFLRELAERSVVFRNAHSTSSWTAPAVASVLTGLYPTDHGIIEGFLAFKRREQKGMKLLPLNRLPDDVTLLAERFADAGYATFGITTNLNIGPEIGFDRGFDRFLTYRKDDASKVEATLMEWEPEIRAATPYFLYLHFMDPHMPYNKRDPWYEEDTSLQGRRGRLLDDAAAYDSEIRYLDEHLRRIYTRFGWDRDTVIAVVSDHGEEFGEHGGTGHEFTLYRELMQALLLVQLPGGTQAASPDVPVSVIDLFPTVLELAGLEAPEVEGWSLAPLWGDQASAARERFRERTVFAHRARFVPELAHCWAAVGDGMKLIQDPEGLELYDMAADRGEQRDLYAERKDDVERLARRLAEFRLRGFRAVEKVEIELDPELASDLEELGYVAGDEDE